MTTIAIIPARGNSKEIPRKNVKLLHGVPLIAYTILPALTCPDLDHVYLSTEDNEIEDVALQYAKILDPELERFHIVHRPMDLSQDWVQNDDVCLHVVRQLVLDGLDFDTVVVLQPTSPFREFEDISNALSLFNDHWSTVISGTFVRDDRAYAWRVNENGDDPHMSPVWHDPTKRYGRQWEADVAMSPNEDGLFYEDGSIYVCSAERFMLERVVRMPPYVPYLSDVNMSIDLNTWEDWEQAEEMAQEYYTTVHYPNA